MEKIVTPTIEVDGVEYKAKRPTMGMWRKCAKQEMSEDEKGSPFDMIDGRLNLVKEFFGIPDDVVENIDVADVLPAYRDVTKYVWKLATSKMGEIPNEGGEND
ncbi:hypothetical protein SELR_18150 [Selenomonas ruminantium subsp. lactilytica TAM6421]|uniref:Phage tail assembly chaperone protein, E, or 41 or 14 n=1 Tax=Selenomonas ruminantium subsp. lactilytica (strain NBRC 103574 / TAM6421) TaxID=927704 RepID=I0GRY6_SELRL|nr:hypothetical protein [Selenomonas ruminantium]BAL83523.1 hypothetical protein SELR_18150 [Selenomonas ruminantium subsp. lactilytica TAM6421]